jgi:hypothetical protein
MLKPPILPSPLYTLISGDDWTQAHVFQVANIRDQ